MSLLLYNLILTHLFARAFICLLSPVALLLLDLTLGYVSNLEVIKCHLTSGMKHLTPHTPYGQSCMDYVQVNKNYQNYQSSSIIYCKNKSNLVNSEVKHKRFMHMKTKDNPSRFLDSLWIYRSKY